MTTTPARKMGSGDEPPAPEGSDEQQKRSEIYTYEAPWHIYAMNWSVRRDKKYRLAIASLLEQYPNRVEIVQLDDSTGDIRPDPALGFEHPYPPTKAIFLPDRDTARPDLLATSGDFLRVWQISDSKTTLKSLLNGNKNSEFCGRLTWFDWNETEPRRIGTSNIDTTCTIWDIEKEVVDTQLIDHNKEVCDIAWGGVGVFSYLICGTRSSPLLFMRFLILILLLYGWDGTSKIQENSKLKLKSFIRLRAL